MRKLGVIREFLRSDCPVKPGGNPIPGFDTGTKDMIAVKNDISDADVKNAVACLGMVPIEGKDPPEWEMPEKQN